MPKSFRLTQEASDTLDRIAKSYKISANKALNIILTQKSPQPILEDDDAAATEIIELYFADLVSSRLNIIQQKQDHIVADG